MVIGVGVGVGVGFGWLRLNMEEEVIGGDDIVGLGVGVGWEGVGEEKLKRFLRVVEVGVVVGLGVVVGEEMEFYLESLLMDDLDWWVDVVGLELKKLLLFKLEKVEELLVVWVVGWGELKFLRLEKVLIWVGLGVVEFLKFKLLKVLLSLLKEFWVCDIFVGDFRLLNDFEEVWDIGCWGVCGWGCGVVVYSERIDCLRFGWDWFLVFGVLVVLVGWGGVVVFEFKKFKFSSEFLVFVVFGGVGLVLGGILDVVGLVVLVFGGGIEVRLLLIKFFCGGVVCFGVDDWLIEFFWVDFFCLIFCFFLIMFRGILLLLFVFNVVGFGIGLFIIYFFSLYLVWMKFLIFVLLGIWLGVNFVF